MPASETTGRTPRPCHYRIKVEGKIDASWSGWFAGMEIDCRQVAGESPVTVLDGPVLDQVALRGLLGRIWDLNLVLISVEHVDPCVRPSAE
jgi:hypothetical protein